MAQGSADNVELLTPLQDQHVIFRWQWYRDIEGTGCCGSCRKDHAEIFRTVTDSDKGFYLLVIHKTPCDYSNNDTGSWSTCINPASMDDYIKPHHSLLH